MNYILKPRSGNQEKRGMILSETLFSIVDEAMESLTQTNEFNDMVQKDPFMSKAMNELRSLSKKAEAIDPMFSEEIDAVTGKLMSASESCGILYGLQIAEAFRSVTDNPLAFSEYVYNRVYGGAVRN